MAASLGNIGQIAPIVARHVTTKSCRLVAGATRLEAAKRLGWPRIQASIVVADNELEYRMAEIDENWERRDLTAEERSKMRRDRADLQRRLMALIKPAKGGRGRKGGIRAAAREAGISHVTALRRRKANKVVQNSEPVPVSAAPAIAANGSDRRHLNPGRPASQKPAFATHALLVKFNEMERRKLGEYRAKDEPLNSLSDCVRGTAPAIQ
jgi:ParB-like nuclease domain